jgi:hypothetical protein
MTETTGGAPAGATGGRFAFLIPVVHPEGSKISDYGVIERALRESLRSYTSQTHRDVVVVVVCHRLPAWAAEFRERVRFVVLGAHPHFAANANDVEIDKGMKYVLGALQALVVEGADFVMPVDGDDFLRVDLAEHVLARDLGGHDGFLVCEGYNALVRVKPASFEIVQTFRVHDFDRTCGTCRIFARAALVRAIERLDPGLLAMADRLVPAADGSIAAGPELLDRLWRATEPATGDYWGTIRLLGRHIRQGGAFDLVPLAAPLAGKACGHGNHDGPSSGGIRWSGVRGCIDTREFARQFGILGGAIELGGRDRRLRLRGAAIGALNRLRRALGVQFGYERQHARWRKAPS